MFVATGDFLQNAGVHPSIHSPDPRTYGVDGPAIEPAVQYVQKIKQRCDPETYRQFLDILSKYHSKPDSIDEVIYSLNPPAIKELKPAPGRGLQTDRQVVQRCS